MIRTWGLFFVGTMVLSLDGCGGVQPSNGDNPQSPVVLGAEPSISLPGSTVTIFGLHFLDDLEPIVRIGGIECTNVSEFSDRIIVHIPQDVAPGHITVDNGTGVGQADRDFIVGSPVAVSEVEPNDEVHGNNATNEGGNRWMTGVLSASTDVDHFKIQNMIQGRNYRIHVSPSIGMTVLVNNVPQTLDATGSVMVKAASDPSTDLASWVFLGLTGVGGPYSVTATIVP